MGILTNLCESRSMNDETGESGNMVAFVAIFTALEAAADDNR